VGPRRIDVGIGTQNATCTRQSKSQEEKRTTRKGEGHQSGPLLPMLCAKFGEEKETGNLGRSEKLRIDEGIHFTSRRKGAKNKGWKEGDPKRKRRPLLNPYPTRREKKPPRRSVLKLQKPRKGNKKNSMKEQNHSSEQSKGKSRPNSEIKSPEGTPPVG